ncbi:MAG: class I SAM-dependent methyltransferase [Pseudomonadales bacterium]
MTASPSTNKFTIPYKLLRGGLKANQKEYVESGRELLKFTCQRLALEDFGRSDILDMGCGTKFTQAFLDYQLPLQHYTGIDVYQSMIEFLQQHVNDARFEYHHMNTHNDMYNVDGLPLTAATQLPLQGRTFDVICLFSVFTHLAPHDYVNMLKVIRPHVRDGGQLIFSLYVDEPSGTGYGLIEDIARDQEGSWKPSGLPFRDAYPGKPLQWALYSREHAFELIESTGWRVENLYMPQQYIQHHFVCTPA